MEELIQKVVDWAEARNLIDGSTPSKQLEKTAAELVELVGAVAFEEGVESSGVALTLTQRDAMNRHIASELGDVLVTLIIVATQLGLSVESCLQVAYDKIKDRKGRMVGGKFVKEEDL